MRNIKSNLLLVLLASIIAFTSCEKEKDDPVGIDSKTVQINASSYSDWVYFSFSEGAEVSVTDPQTDSNWDIGIKRNHFKTNGGASGSGEGAVFDAGVVDFDSFNKAPSEGYVADSSIEVFDFASKEYNSEPGSTVLETWGEFTDAMPPTLVPSEKVFVVKTADGKFAKMIVQNYYGTEGSGYITFTYAYQPDGSTTLASK